MSNLLYFLAIAAVGITAGVLLMGVGGFGTGKISSRGQNKLMRWRIIAQFVAVILILLAVLASRGEA